MDITRTNTVIAISVIVYLLIGFAWWMFLDMVFDYDEVKWITGQSRRFIVILCLVMSVTAWPLYFFHIALHQVRKRRHGSN